MSYPKVLIIVPAYNEEGNIRRVIASLNSCNANWDVVVINDGSTDNTEKVAKEAGGAVVITLPCNLGIGGGVQTGFKYAYRNDYDIAVQFDGDGQHIAEEIPKILHPIIALDKDVVVGSRFIGANDGFKSTFVRRMGIKIFEILNSVLIRQRITDNTSGFRAYNKKAIALLSRFYPVDYPEPEAIILLGKNGCSIAEVPVRMQEREQGVSSINGLKPLYYMVKVILSILIAAIQPAVVYPEKLKCTRS